MKRIQKKTLQLMLSRAQTTGELTGPRAEMLQKAFVLPNKSARHLMVPRNEVVFLDINQSVEENIERAMLTTHSRFPLRSRTRQYARRHLASRPTLLRPRKR